MRSLFFLLVIITIHSFSYSQGIQFEKILPLPPAPQKSFPQYGSYPTEAEGSKFVDLDLDGDLDLMIFGSHNSNSHFSHKLMNDGFGNFSEQPCQILDFWQGTARFSDIDGDLDPDLIISGKRMDNQIYDIKVYINDGNASFNELTNHNLPFSNIFALQDFNGDLFPDLVFTDGDGDVYINDGVGNFTEVNGVGLSGYFIWEGTIETFDFEGDGDIDILAADYEYSKYYFHVNDGSGNFTLSQQITKPSSQTISPVSIGDINSDGFIDVFAVEEDINDSLHLVLYKNNGSGNFLLDSIFSFSGYRTDLLFKDLNNDGFDDLINLGDYYTYISDPDIIHSTKILFNDGNGGFVEDSIPILECPVGSVSYADYGDIDSDGDIDLVYSSSSPDGGISNDRTVLLENDGTGKFKRVIDNDFMKTKGDELAVGDLNGDGFPDIIVGGGPYHRHLTSVYLNNGFGNFTQSTQVNLPRMKNGDATIGDYNNDGVNDFILAGNSDSGGFLHLYVNSGGGLFTLAQVFNIPIYADNFTLNTLDLDNDGDLDLFAVGDNLSNVYKNDGLGNFSFQNTSFPKEAIKLADFDNDGYLDYVCGFPGGISVNFNNGSGAFTSSSPITFDDYDALHLNFADFDNDGDIDILGSGYISSPSNPTTKIYINNGSGVYSAIYPPVIDTLALRNTCILDLDQDGFMDIICSAWGHLPLIVLMNDTQGGYVNYQTPFWRNSLSHKISHDDLNQDGKEDIITSGWDFGDLLMPRVYLNTSSACVSTFSFDTIVTCDSLIWMDGNTYYNDTTGISYTLVNANIYGCDSIVNLDLTIKHSGFGIEYHTVCDSLVWIDGNTYYTNNNTATYRIPNGAANGCDSIVILDLVVNQAVSGVDIQSSCDSLVWIDGNTYYTSNNTASYTIPNGSINGCDSIVTLNFSIIPPSIGTDTVKACDSLVWIDGNTYYTSNNTASYTIPNGSINGCDSIVSLDLTIIDVDTSNTVIQDTIWSNQLNASYQWLDGGNGFAPIAGETGAFFVPDITGNYAVEIIYSGCVDTSSTQLIQICDVVSSFSSIDNGNGDFEFTSYSTGNINKVLWNFGDGSFSNQINPQHYYSINGPISVSLAVQDSTISPFGSCVDYYYDFIAVSGVSNPNQCLAAFIVIPDSSSNDLWVINNSSGTNLNYTWDFGDGASSNLENPSHLYSANGAYNLCLAIDDLNGCSDTFCDSVSYLGSVFRQSGFSINIISGAILAEVNYISDGSIKISPNPALDFATLVNLAPPINSVKIYASNGKFVGQFEVTSSGVVDIQMLSAGVYYMLIETPDSKSVLRLVKE